MNGVTMRRIDETNYLDCFRLELGEGQDRFVSHPIRSLAQAYVYYQQCTPFGIYYNGVIVGYVMVIYDYDDETYNIWHMMIDKGSQHRGFGHSTVGSCLDYIRTKPFGASDIVVLSCHDENIGAIRIYEKYGFKATGERDEDEIIMKLVM